MSYADDIEAAKKASIEKYLAQAHGNVVRAALLAGIHRSNFYALMRRFAIQRKRADYADRGNAAWLSLE